MQKIDAVMPSGNEQEFLDMALALGLKGLIFVSADIRYKLPALELHGLSVKSGYVLKDASEIHRARKYFDYVFAPAERKYFELGPDYIFNAELSEKRDSFHYRSTSLNQVHAKLAHDKGTCISFNFGLLFSKDVHRMQLIMGRMMQNARLVRKYDLRSNIFSYASSPYRMVGPGVLDALETILL